MALNTVYENEVILLRVMENFEGNTRNLNPEILLVMDGTYIVEKEGRSWILHENDFLLLNSQEKFSIATKEKGLLAVLELKYNRISKFINLYTYKFFCSSFEKESGMDKIRQLVQRIINLSFCTESSEQALLLSTCYQLIYYLREYCLEKNDVEGTGENNEDAKRTQKIQEYIQENYNQPITLQDLSEETYFSAPYLSKYIKKKFGRNLTTLLNEIRLEHAVEDLKHTDDTFTKIAMNQGFSNVAAFNKAFKEKYKQTPSDFRKEWKKNQEKEQREGQKNSSEIKGKMQEYLSQYGFQNYTEGAIFSSANLANARFFKRFWNRMMNIGGAKDLLRADVQEHVLILQKELDIRYVRFWDIYAQDLMLYDGNPERRYNFSRLDIILDFLHEHQLIPYIELGFKPHLLMKEAEHYMIRESREILFENPDQYGDFLEQFFHHYVIRYGIEEVSQWYLEEWDDPRFKDFETYIQYFEKLYAKAKKFSPDIKVGGGGFGFESRNTFDRMLKIWKTRYCYPDFISLYGYPYYASETDETIQGRRIEYFSKDNNYMKNHVDWAIETMHENDFWNQELHLSEWNFSVENRNGLHDSIFKGAYIVKNLLDFIDKLDVAGYWFASDLFTEFYDTGALLDGSGGLLTKDGIRKPAFYAFDFFNRLETYLLGKDEYAAVTTNLHDSYVIVCHNYCAPNYLYYEENRKAVSVQNADLYYTKEEKKFRFQIKNVRNGTYQIKTRMVDERYGSVLDEWRKMEYTQYLNAQDIAYLRQICVPRITIYSVEVKDGTLEIPLKLSANAIASIHAYYVM